MESRFDKVRDISQGLHRTLSDTFTSASMSLVQIKVIYDYYSSKRVTPFFIGEEELLESPSVQGVGTDRCEMKTNPPPNRPKHLPTLLEAPRAKRSLQLQGRSKAEEYESADLCGEESCETNDQKFGKTSGLCAPTKSQDNTNQQTPLERFFSKTEEQINKKQEIIERLQNKENEILAKLERVKSDPRDGNICRNCHLRLGHSARTCQFGRTRVRALHISFQVRRRKVSQW